MISNIFKPKLLLSIAASALLISSSFVGSANAEEATNESDKYEGYYWSSDNYIAGSLGFLAMGDQSYVNGATRTLTDFKTGLGASLYFGFESQLVNQFGWRPELEFTYKRNNVAEHKTPTTTINNSDGELKSYSLLANFYYDFTNSTNLTPYIGAGAGGSIVDFKNYTGAGTQILDDSDSVFAYQFMVGVNYDFTQAYDIFWDYRYFATFAPDVTTASSNGQELDYETHSFNVGVKYKF